MDPVFENFMIYAENLSLFYVICILLTFLAVFATWKIDVEDPKMLDSHKKPSNIEEESNFKKAVSGTSDNEHNDIKFPPLEKKLLLENMSKSLNLVEMEKEKEIEKQQLASIYELIKKDQSKFKIESLQQLEEQMKLYREWDLSSSVNF